FAGAGPYTLANGESIAAGATHTYTLTMYAQLSAAVLEGTESVSLCELDQGDFIPGQGLFNRATLVYGSGPISIDVDDCGNVPPFLVQEKVFVGVSDIDGGGNFTSHYTVVVRNVGGQSDTYNLVENPLFDSEVTLLGVVVTNHVNLALVGAPPYTLATGEPIAVGGIHTYNLSFSAQLSAEAMDGSVTVSECGETSQDPVAGEGLFNESILTMIASGNVVTNEACGNLPPIPRFEVVKELISPLGRPAILGEELVFTLTVSNTGEVDLGLVPLVDTYDTTRLEYASSVPAPDGVVPGTLTWNDLGPLLVGDAVVVTTRFAAISVGIETNTVVASPSTTNGVPLPPQTSSVPHEAQTQAITGSVFEDANANGIFDPEDLTNGLAGVTINLYDAQTNLIASTLTDSTGFYAFTNLLPGVYIIEEIDPPGYFSTADTDPPNDNLITVTLTSGEDSTGNDFLDARFAAVGDFVWRDFNDNGIQDFNEPGFNVPLRLTLFDATSNVVAVTTSTTAGAYAFTNLFPGSYFIRIDLPPGSRLSPQFQGSDPARDNDFNPLNNRTPIFPLLPGQNNTNVDAGIYVFQILAQVEEVFGVSDGKVNQLVWSTESEFGTAGWLVEREVDEGTFVRVSDFLPAGGSLSAGATYRWPDHDTMSGETHRYRLVEVEVDGVERVYGPYEIQYPRSSRRGTAALAGSFSLDVKDAPVAESIKVSSRTRSSLSSAPASAAKVSVRGDQWVGVGVADLAAILGMADSALAETPLRVSHLGRDVPAVRTGEGDLYFFAPAYASLYTDENVFQVSLGKGLDLPVLTVDSADSASSATFVETLVIEEQKILRADLVRSDDEDMWLWAHQISGFSSPFTTSVDVPGRKSGTTGSLTVRLKGSSPHAHAAEVSFNGVILGQVQFHGLEVIESTFELSSGSFASGNNQIRVAGIPPQAGVMNHFYIDRFNVTYHRELVAQSDRLVADVQAGPVELRGYSSPDIVVLDITDPLQPTRLTGMQTLQGAGGYGVRFAAPQAMRLFSTVGPVAADDLTGWSGDTLRDSVNHADVLVIYASELQTGAHALAADRAAKGLLAKAVSIDDVYNAFNHGIRDARALRSFLGYAYRQWETGPRYVVLVGSGSLDYRNFSGHGDSLLPVPAALGSSGQFASDQALADITGDGTMDLAIGRIPARSPAELTAYLLKLQAFEQGGEWRERALIATDNRDYGGIYMDDANRLAAHLAGRTVDRADMETLGVAGAASALLQGLNDGRELALYIGHGNRLRMAEEGILRTQDLAQLNNTDRAGVIGALGCLMGSFSIPGSPGIGEQLITRSGGAAAVFGSASMVNNLDGVNMADALLEAIYGQGEARLGDAWVTALNSPASLLSRDATGTYQFLGDPSIALGSPYAPRGGPAPIPSRGTYEEWASWAFSPAWRDLGYATGPDDDPDGDGMTNWEEFIAGTNPMDPDSDFVVVTVKPLPDGTVQLSWPAVPGRLYRIERAPSLGVEFEVIADDQVADPPVSVWIDAQANGNQGFYRVGVK
ncbi:MAG TPA: C25 family cysteine peptidase, partial [Kiritimatiellia bacterium]|nr:C25 family cysteine peptidase [Kiritimatiellia bacterium]